MKKAVFWLTCLVVLLFLQYVKASQHPSPCSGFLTYKPADIPFPYDASLCGDQIFGWFDMLAGQRASCSINVCDPQNIPVEVTFTNFPAALTYDSNTWQMEWITTTADVGLYYVNAVADKGTEQTVGTILFNVKEDTRPRFELIVPLVLD